MYYYKDVWIIAHLLYFLTSQKNASNITDKFFVIYVKFSNLRRFLDEKTLQYQAIIKEEI